MGGEEYLKSHSHTADDTYLALNAVLTAIADAVRSVHQRNIRVAHFADDA